MNHNGHGHGSGRAMGTSLPDEDVFVVVDDPGEGAFERGATLMRVEVAQMLYNAAFNLGTRISGGGVTWMVVDDPHIKYNVERQMLREAEGKRELVSLQFRLVAAKDTK